MTSTAPAPLIIGVTGGIGCGKSTVTARFAALGAGIVDTDTISHQLTAAAGAALPALRAHFGAAIFRPDGQLDRDALRQRVFADSAERQALESILFPLIRSHTWQQCAEHAARHPYLLLVVPLLLAPAAQPYRQRCDRILVIDCSRAQQIERVMARSGLSADEVEAIIAAQATRAARQAAADDLIDNSGPPERLTQPIAELHRHYLELAAEKVKANH